MSDDLVTAYSWNRPVIATRTIHQSPLSSDQDVPPGRAGWLQDVADDLLWVDFGDRYGVVACEPGDLAQR
jgi:hypothetical protein